AVERASKIGPAALDETRADARTELARRLLRVRDHEDGLDVDTLVADRAREALDEHARLTGAGAGRDEDEPAGIDGCALFPVQVHARLTRHIGQSSHHVGQSPPFGSCRMSPPRMRSTRPTASSRERSTWF